MLARLLACLLACSLVLFTYAKGHYTNAATETPISTRIKKKMVHSLHLSGQQNRHVRTVNVSEATVTSNTGTATTWRSRQR